MNKLIISAILIATLSGCATKTIPLTSSVGNAYRGKSITYAVRETPSFSAMTAGKAMFGAVGGAAMVVKGNEIVRENHVPDPAITIGATLVNDLATKYGLIVKKPIKRTSSKKPTQVASDYSNADLVLDVRTKGWGFVYFPMDWNNYRILYNDELFLIDTAKSEVIASGSSKYDSAKVNSSHPSYEKLINNQAAGLKQELKKAQSHSINEFRRNIFRAR